VIISNAIALAQEVEKREAGFIFPPENEERLMENILQMKDANLRQKLGDNGRALVAQKYALDGLGDRLGRMYKAVFS
jgi:glycosyltransferase involved in cell wall biosynthesis